MTAATMAATTGQPGDWQERKRHTCLYRHEYTAIFLSDGSRCSTRTLSIDIANQLDTHRHVTGLRTVGEKKKKKKKRGKGQVSAQKA